MNSASPGELAREAEASRARLDLTIERIQSRLTPLGLLDEAVGFARRTSPVPLVDRSIRTLRENPLPAVLIAAGAGLLAWRLLDRQRSRPALTGPSRHTAEPAAGTDRNIEPDSGAKALIIEPQGEAT